MHGPSNNEAQYDIGSNDNVMYCRCLKKNVKSNLNKN